MPIPPKEVFKTRLEEFLTLHGLIFAGATQLVAPAPDNAQHLQ
jgi:hypothetical protein